MKAILTVFVLFQTYIVRQASKKDTMALSVRLAEGPNIEHYLIESTPKGLKLEGSHNFFPAIPVLIAHYCDCRYVLFFSKLANNQVINALF